MKRVLFISPSGYPLGGLATWLDYLAPGLQERGWEVYSGLTSGRFHDVAAYVSKHPLPNVIEVENRTGSREGRVRALSRVVELIRPDIVAGINIVDTYKAVSRARRRAGLASRVLMTIHGLQPDVFDDCRVNRPRLDGVVCSNRLACELAERRTGVDPGRIHYAPYGVESSPHGRRSRGPEEPLKIGYSGRLDRFQKRAQDIPRILGELEKLDCPYEFVVAGGGPEEEWLRGELASSQSASRVTFLGSLTYPEVVEQVYLVADVLLVTSYWETGPLVIWEAMAHGMTVVSSAYIGSGQEDALQHNSNCLLFPIGDANAAARCLKEASDPAVSKRVGEGGRRLVKSRYRRDLSVDAWNAAFRAVLAAPPLGEERVPELGPQSGRLNRWLGTSRAEDLRSRLGIGFSHSDPGGEWPHSYGQKAKENSLFWQQLEKLDLEG